MNEDDLQKLLKRVWAQKITVEEASRALVNYPYDSLPFARVDTQRELRCGFPEVIFCQGKRPEDIRTIARSILRASDVLLATRADKDAYEAIRAVSRRAIYHERARCVTVLKRPPAPASGRVLIVCAGTADAPVAEEARVTAETLGSEVDTLYDVGVAGLHRLLSEREKIERSDAIVVVAGMEGALASVVGGLSRVPVVAVPTSVGYGASFGGVAALLTMLNSCAAGVSVVNIDNGFGAAYTASLIARRPASREGGTK
jgi:NCAIR mutase (PurE)-related protein